MVGVVLAGRCAFVDLGLGLGLDDGLAHLEGHKSGLSRAKGLDPKLADRSGFVTWRWRVGSKTTPGQWPGVVTCEHGGNRGELTTMLEVR